jgi:two-component system, chemotaxis family, protein-glutamate methylesterase/glutaminase
MAYDFNVIGIGLSAGGLEPLIDIVTALPGDIPAALVILPHMPPNAESRLNDILGRASRLIVVTVHTIEYLEAGHCYVPAKGHQLIVKGGFVEVQPRLSEPKLNRTIDTFFSTLAKDAAEKAIGIILSGAGYDGLEGAKKIEDGNGLVIVQDPDSAEFPLMPYNLIANDHPDYVLTPDEIAEKIRSQLARAA